jgi:matrixin
LDRGTNIFVIDKIVRYVHFIGGLGYNLALSDSQLLEDEMNKTTFPRRPKQIAQALLLLTILFFSLGMGNVNSVAASTALNQESCGQMLADAEARFLSVLAPDGSVPANPTASAAAQEYINVSKLCYENLEGQKQAGTLQAETPSFIDDGGLFLDPASSGQFVLTNTKWGSNSQGTSGGTVTYSFMGNGKSFSAESYGNSVAITSLPGFQPCFITDIQHAFAAWQAVSNIRFVQVNDSGSAFNAPGATGDIRIGAHTFDGPSGTLAHAYYPPPNGDSAAGDLHIDSAENWSCNTNGIDIGVVAMHEIGHSIGLLHENTSSVAVMDPTYNPSLATLQSDDINGAIRIYGGTVVVAAPPPNDSVANATVIGSLPFSQILDTTGATTDGPAGQVLCSGAYINKGTKNVWYKYTTPGSSASTIKVSFDTLGSNYDTYIAVRTSGLSLVGCNDDTATGFQSQLVVKLNGGTSYYIEVAQYNGNTPGNIPNPEPPAGTLKFRALASGGADTVGVFRPSNGLIYLKNSNTTGFADIGINYGQGGDYPVTGDWDGNGTDTIGVYRAGSFLLRNSNTVGFADLAFAFGSSGDQPIAGDWNGDGIDTIGVYRRTTFTFYLRNSNTAGPADIVFSLGAPGDIGIAGDWTKKGYDTVGVFRPSNGVIYLKNTNTPGFADIGINYGQGGDKPVTGDWNNDGFDTIGVLRGNTFLLRNSNTPGFADLSFALGVPGDMPIAGNWDGIP